MNRTSVIMIASTLLLYGTAVILFDVTKCLPTVFNPVTNSPFLNTLLCNR